MDEENNFIELERARIKEVRERDQQINMLGGTTSSENLAIKDEAAEVSSYGLVEKGFRTLNAAVGLQQWGDRKLIPADPAFKLEDHKTELLDGIPSEYWNGFASVRSLAEARELRADTLQELDDLRILGNAGARGIVASGLAGIVDIDMPLIFLSEGTYLGAKTAALTAKVGLAGTRTGAALKMGAAGAEAGLLTETANAFVRPTGDWTNIPTAGLSGFIFGGTIGAAAGKQLDQYKQDESGSLNLDAFFGADPRKNANTALARAREDFADAVTSGQAGRVDYSAKVAPDDDVFTFADDVDTEAMSEGMAQLSQKAAEFLETRGINKQREAAFSNTVSGQAAKKFYNFIKETPIATDWDDLMNSNSNVAKVFAYKAFESASGIVRNNRSGAAVSTVYQNQIAAPVLVNYPDLVTKWASKRTDTPNFLNTSRQSVIDSFNKEVVEELQYRYHDNVSNPNSDEFVIQMADHIDAASAKAAGILKGSPSEIAVRGAEDLGPERGWFRQLWRGDRMIEVIKNIDKQSGKGAGKAAITDTLTASYRKLHGWDEKYANRVAKAVVRGALARERGIDTNLARMLDSEGAEYMIEFLRDHGFSKKDAERLIEGLKGLKSEQGKVNIVKNRKDIDLREQIPGTNYRLMDLVDTDIVTVWSQYSRRAAGASALARQGIQKSDKKRIIDAILSEEAATGKQTLSREQLEGMFSYFEGGAFAGGVNPWARRALQLTNLSLLNSLGLTQTAEAGVQAAAVGVDAFRRSAPKEVQELLSGKNSALTEELRPWTAVIDGEHRVFMDHLALDDTRVDPGAFAEAGKFMDGLLVRGSRIQGYVSGFYKVKQLQQRTAVRSVLYRLADMYKKDKAMSPARLYDMGFTDKAMVDRIGGYFKNGTVELDDANNVLKMNFDKWDQEDVFDFALILNRHTDQVVQKAMRGESSVWMHKTHGALLAHLKTFTILTMQKQLIRNARIMDTEASMAFIYSLGTAAAAYSAQQALKGNTENLDAEHIAKGAFMLSNMTGWIPQWSDPLMSMLGMDNLRFNHYGAVGVGGDVIGTPPVLPTLNRISHIPEAGIDVLTGQARNEDIYALQATPIIGNLYGFSFMFNEMKDSLNNVRAKEEREQQK